MNLPKVLAYGPHDGQAISVERALKNALRCLEAYAYDEDGVRTTDTQAAIDDLTLMLTNVQTKGI